MAFYGGGGDYGSVDTGSTDTTGSTGTGGGYGGGAGGTSGNFLGQIANQFMGGGGGSTYGGGIGGFSPGNYSPNSPDFLGGQMSGFSGGGIGPGGQQFTGAENLGGQVQQGGQGGLQGLVDQASAQDQQAAGMGGGQGSGGAGTFASNQTQWAQDVGIIPASGPQGIGVGGGNFDFPANTTSAPGSQLGQIAGQWMGSSPSQGQFFSPSQQVDAGFQAANVQPVQGGSPGATTFGSPDTVASADASAAPAPAPAAAPSGGGGGGTTTVNANQGGTTIANNYVPQEATASGTTTTDPASTTPNAQVNQAFQAFPAQQVDQAFQAQATQDLASSQAQQLTNPPTPTPDPRDAAATPAAATTTQGPAPPAASSQQGGPAAQNLGPGPHGPQNPGGNLTPAQQDQAFQKGQTIYDGKGNAYTYNGNGNWTYQGNQGNQAGSQGGQGKGQNAQGGYNNPQDVPKEVQNFIKGLMGMLPPQARRMLSPFLRQLMGMAGPRASPYGGPAYPGGGIASQSGAGEGNEPQTEGGTGSPNGYSDSDTGNQPSSSSAPASGSAPNPITGAGPVGPQFAGVNTYGTGVNGSPVPTGPGGTSLAGLAGQAGTQTDPFANPIVAGNTVQQPGLPDPNITSGPVSPGLAAQGAGNPAALPGGSTPAMGTATGQQTAAPAAPGLPQPTVIRGVNGYGQAGFNPSLRRDRAGYAQQITSNPALRNRILQIMYNEQGTNPAGVQAVAESLLNRASARGQSLSQVARWHGLERGGYYQPGGGVRFNPAANPRATRILNQALSNALAGSNISGMATDNSSGVQTARDLQGGKFNKRSGYNGETFFTPGNAEPGLAIRYRNWLARINGGPMVASQ